MLVVPVGDGGDIDDDANVHRIEFMVDHGAVADSAAETQISLDHRRQIAQRRFPVDPVGGQQIHIDVAVLDRDGPVPLGRQVVVVQIGERPRDLFGVGAVQAGAAEQEGNVVRQDVGRYAAPKDLHGPSCPVGGVDAGTAHFENFAGLGHQPVDVVLRCGVEAADPLRAGPAQHAIGADDAFRPDAQIFVQHDQMIAMGVESVEIALEPRHLSGRPGGHFLVEDPIPEREGGIDFRFGLGQPDPQPADALVDLARGKTLGVTRIGDGERRHRRTGATPPPGSAARRVQRRRNASCALLLAGVEFEPVVDDFIPEFRRDPVLQLLDLVVAEFDDLAGLHIDQMIVMLLGRFLIARAPVAEIVTVQDIGLLEQANRPVDG